VVLPYPPCEASDDLPQPRTRVRTLRRRPGKRRATQGVVITNEPLTDRVLVQWDDELRGEWVSAATVAEMPRLVG
jgi:hypothetical protein